MKMEEKETTRHLFLDICLDGEQGSEEATEGERTKRSSVANS